MNNRKVNENSKLGVFLRPLQERLLGSSLRMATAIIVGATGIALMAPSANAQYNKNQTNIKRHDFSDSTLGGMSEDQGVSLNNLSSNGIYFVNDNARGGKVLKFVWKESEYDGTRGERGHEIKHNVYDNNELFSGFLVYVPSNGFPYDKDTIIWQLYNWGNSSQGACSNWTAHISIVDNEFILTSRGVTCSSNSSYWTETNLGSVSRNQDLRFAIQTSLSGADQGYIRVNINGSFKGEQKNIDLGFGSFTNGYADWSQVGVKMGMYCWDTANYSNNETRSLYYDDFCSVKNWSNSSSWNAVNAIP